MESKILKANGIVAAVGVERFAPSEGSTRSAAAPRSIEAVEEALIEAHGLWRRSPGAGRWPFAGDGPWHLIQGEAGDYAGDGVDGVSSSRAPRCPLDAAEVARRDAVTAWLQLLADPLDRRIVWGATGFLARGETRVPWKALGAAIGTAGLEQRSGRPTGAPLTRQALLRRYRKALALVVCGLNRWPERRAKALLARDGLVAEPAVAPAMVVSGE